MSMVRSAIRFQFDFNKAVAAMVYFLRRLGHLDKIKLIKLLYIADRESLLRLGYPITGDQPCAMKFGPVPSACLDTLNGERQEVFQSVHVVDNRVKMARTTDTSDHLNEAERAILDGVISSYGRVPTWVLVEQTHEFPEYKEVNIPGTSTPIPYEVILKHHGDEKHFRHNKPVISREMASRMLYPFVRPEPDL